MPVGKKLKIASLIIMSFLSLTVLIVFLAANGFLTGAQAGLMVVALVGLYVGFGILIAVYRLVHKLE